MARPIKDTPVISGKDAKRFTESISKGRKVSEAKYQKAMSVYKKVIKKAQI
jgi:hypothetical protein